MSLEVYLDCCGITNGRIYRIEGNHKLLLYVIMLIKGNLFFVQETIFFVDKTKMKIQTIRLQFQASPELNEGTVLINLLFISHKSLDESMNNKTNLKLTCTRFVGKGFRSCWLKCRGSDQEFQQNCVRLQP